MLIRVLIREAIREGPAARRRRRLGGGGASEPARRPAARRRRRLGAGSAAGGSAAGGSAAGGSAAAAAWQRRRPGAGSAAGGSTAELRGPHAIATNRRKPADQGRARPPLHGGSAGRGLGGRRLGGGGGVFQLDPFYTRSVGIAYPGLSTPKIVFFHIKNIYKFLGVPFIFLVFHLFFRFAFKFLCFTH